MLKSISLKNWQLIQRCRLQHVPHYQSPLHRSVPITKGLRQTKWPQRVSFLRAHLGRTPDILHIKRPARSKSPVLHQARHAYPTTKRQQGKDEL